MKKNYINKRRKNYRSRNYIRVTLVSAAILGVFGTGVFLCSNMFKTRDDVEAQAQVNKNEQNMNDGNSSKDADSDKNISKLDNSGYLTLENDPNAEDALEVFHTTESLLKGTTKYPVRNDGKKVVYLTFDDGPSTENTADVLDTLHKYGVKATFFVTGVSIDKSEQAKELLKRIAAEGNAIGNHTYGHDYKKLYPNKVIDAAAFMADVEKNNETMRNVLGKDFSTRVIRFPGGYWSWNGRSSIRPIIDEKGYAIMDWNTLNEDAQGKPKNAQELVERTKANVEVLGENADSIVFLMHDTYGKKETAKALPQIIEYFESKGFEFKTMK